MPFFLKKNSLEKKRKINQDRKTKEKEEEEEIYMTIFT